MMAGAVRFTVAGCPVPQGSMTPIGRGRMIHKPELVHWRESVRSAAVTAAKRASWKLPLDEPVEVRAMFYLPSPKRPRWRVPGVRPDLDKLTRAVGDALSPKHGEGVLAEDSRIIAWTVSKEYAPTGGERAEIKIIRRADDE